MRGSIGLHGIVAASSPKLSQHELTRRQRDALLQSLSSPHPEIIELADIGLADWTSDLPNDDEGLVDPRGGTAVRWIEDRGWVKEPT